MNKSPKVRALTEDMDATIALIIRSGDEIKPLFPKSVREEINQFIKDLEAIRQNMDPENVSLGDTLDLIAIGLALKIHIQLTINRLEEITALSAAKPYQPWEEAAERLVGFAKALIRELCR